METACLVFMTIVLAQLLFLPMRSGASLRDRATLPSPLRGLGPAGGYPSRLRSLRSLRAPLARRLRRTPRRCGQQSPPPAAPCRARPAAAPAASPAAHSPRRLPPAGFTGNDVPSLNTPLFSLSRRRRRLCSHTPRSKLRCAPRVCLSFSPVRFRRQSMPWSCWAEWMLWSIACKPLIPRDSSRGRFSGDFLSVLWRITPGLVENCLLDVRSRGGGRVLLDVLRAQSLS